MPNDIAPFSVWAPEHQTVTLEVRKFADPAVPRALPSPTSGESPNERSDSRSIQRFALEPAGAGWWRLPTDRVTAELLDSIDENESSQVDYGYLIDGRGPFPDPRSRRQPYGVHSLSRAVPGPEFTWTDNGWLGKAARGAVLYELHVGTFTPEGTFAAAIHKLDHLRSIGVEFVELLPVNAFNGPHNWGYDGVGWFAVHEDYGGPRGYKEFVDACHNAGIGVIQDVVYNHLGPSGNYLPEFGPYLRSDAGTVWGKTVNLDGPDSDEVRQFILDNVAMWFSEYHVDGLRLDAVHALIDTRAVSLVEEIAAHTATLSSELGRPLSVIAESDLNDPRLFEPRELGGLGLDAQWSDDYHHALRVALTADASGYYADFADPHALGITLTRGFFHAGRYSSFRRRHHGRPIRTAISSPNQLVVFSQNHDQVGNRAAGDRLSASLSEGQLAIAATLTLLGPGTPQLFMGEEWAATSPWQFFTSHPEPELAAATAAGRLREFAALGWKASEVPDPQDPETFYRSKLRWDERSGDRQSRILNYYKLLATERAQTRLIPEFADLLVWQGPPRTWLAVRCGGRIIVVNFGTTTESVALDEMAGSFEKVPVVTPDTGVPARPPQPQLQPQPAAHLLLGFGAIHLDDRRRYIELGGHSVAVLHSR